jgi:hypothetical protein
MLLFYAPARSTTALASVSSDVEPAMTVSLNVGSAVAAVDGVLAGAASRVNRRAKPSSDPSACAPVLVKDDFSRWEQALDLALWALPAEADPTSRAIWEHNMTLHMTGPAQEKDLRALDRAYTVMRKLLPPADSFGRDVVCHNLGDLERIQTPSARPS